MMTMDAVQGRYTYIKGPALKGESHEIFKLVFHQFHVLVPLKVYKKYLNLNLKLNFFLK